jgi:hypothetical protein
MSNSTPTAPNTAVKTPVKPGVPVNGAKPTNGAALATQVVQGKQVTGEPAAPIEPSMWKRYSPHHEFPLSVLATFVLYFFAVLIVLVLGGLVLNLWGSGEPPEIENIEFAGGGGDPLGSRDSNVNNGPQEALDFNLSDERTDTVVIDTKPDLTATDTTPRLIEEAQKTKQSFTPNSFGRGGTGTGGGKGSGHGTGEGDGSGPGKQSKREKRKDRWIVNFPFTSGDQYLRYLASLDSYIAYPEGEGKFRMFDNLSNRPLSGRTGTVADIKKWNRIYWRDTNPDAAQAIAAALNLSSAPPFFWVFFPKELEDELFAKELAYRGLTEDQIVQRNLETFFTVDRSGGKYNVRVTKQDRRQR